MTKGQLSSKDSKPCQETLDNKAQELFLDYLQKCREIYGTKYNHESDIDSEVSLLTRNMLDEFDKYRTDRK